MLVFGEPYEAKNGTVIITVAREGWFGRSPHPVGIYTISAGETTWTPAVDTGRYKLVAVCTGFVAAAFATAALIRRPPWPELTAPVMIALHRGSRGEIGARTHADPPSRIHPRGR